MDRQYHLKQTSVPFFWSRHYDLSLAYVGHAPAWDRVVTQGRLDAADFAAFYLREGRVLAVVTAGRDQVALRTEAAMEAGDEAALAALMEGSDSGN